MANSTYQPSQYTVATETQRGVVNGSDLRDLAFGSSALAFRNKIINGAMTIDQRNAGTSVSLTDSTVTFITDRFYVYESTDGTLTAQQVSDAPAGFTKSLKVTVGTADASLSAAQRAMVDHKIEGSNVADLAWGTSSAKNITVSFWVKSSLTGVFGFTTGDMQTNYMYATTYTINNANTWEYKIITIPGPSVGTWNTTNGLGLVTRFSLGVGSNYIGTLNTWVTGIDVHSPAGAVSVIGAPGATWQITGLQLEAGSVATPFEK